MPSPAHGHGQLSQSWANPDDPNSTYYPNASYPSVYSQMFQNLGNNTTDEAAGQNGSNGLHDLAMASASTYYSDYDAEGQPQVGPDGEPLPDLQFIPRQRGEASNQIQPDTEVAQPTHRVRKADRNRICTSCGTTNSPGMPCELIITKAVYLTMSFYCIKNGGRDLAVSKRSATLVDYDTLARRRERRRRNRRRMLHWRLRLASLPTSHLPPVRPLHPISLHRCSCRLAWARMASMMAKATTHPT